MLRKHAGTLLGAVAPTTLSEVATVPVAPSFPLDAAPVSEDARQVAARLRLLIGSDGGFLAVAGVSDGDGCTQLASRLAGAMSQIASFPTLLIESEASGAPGLLDVLSGNADLARAARPTAGGNLYVLPYGSASTTLPSLLSSVHGSVALAALRGRFPYVFADVGAVLSNPESLLLASRADGVVAAVRAGARRRHEVKHFHEELQRLAIRLLGVVLTVGTPRR